MKYQVEVISKKRGERRQLVLEEAGKLPESSEASGISPIITSRMVGLGYLTSSLSGWRPRYRLLTLDR